MFEDQNSVHRWFSNLPNAGTRNNYLFWLNRYTRFTSKGPDQLIEDAVKKGGEYAHEVLKEFYNNISLSSGTKMVGYQAIRSFYAANRIVLGKKPRTFRAVVEFESRKLYSQDDVAMLVDAADNVRDKALICFIAQSGQRIGVVCALRIQHIELEQEAPIIVDVPGILRDKNGLNVNKAQLPYRFAVGLDTRNYLELMLRERRDRGEAITGESWLFRSHSQKIATMRIRKVRLSTTGQPISIAQASAIVRHAANVMGIQEKTGKRYLYHPHGFRRYWKHQMRMGGADPDLLEYMMGHAQPYGGAYDRWTTQDIKTQYHRAENMIALRPVVTITKDDIREEVLKVLLGKMSTDDLDQVSQNMGIPPQQIKRLIQKIGK